MKRLRILHSCLLLPLVLLLLQRGLGQGTTFTYQGRLEDGGRPATGLYEIQFQVFDREVPSGTEIRSVPVLQTIGVTNGVFTTLLDFGDALFNGADRYLELSVRPSGSLTPLEKLVPRQRITPTPYAMRAAGLVGPLPVNQLPSGVLMTDASRTLQGSIRATDASNVFAGDGSALSGVQAAALGGRGEVRVQEAFYRRLETSERPGLPWEYSSGVLAGDFNGDGLTDLIGSLTTSQFATLHTNAGRGRLVLAMADLSGIHFDPKQAVKGHFNSDASLDIAVWSPNESRINVYTNSSAGDMSLMTSIPITNVSALAAIDVNRDGLTDLAVAHTLPEGSQIRIILNSGSGLAFYAALSVPSPVADLAVGDVNGDAALDLAAACVEASEIRVFINTGSGLQASATIPAVRPRALALGALGWSGSGYTYVSEPSVVDGNSEESMIRSVGRGESGDFRTLSARLPMGVDAAEQWVKLEVRDLNGDGRNDVIAAVLHPGRAARMVRYDSEFNSSTFRRTLDWENPGFSDFELADFDESWEPDLGTSVRGGVAVWARDYPGLTTGTPAQFESGVGVLGELNAFNGLSVASGLKVNGGAQISGVSSAEELRVTSQLRVSGASRVSDLYVDGQTYFGYKTRQMVNLFGIDYGMGVQPNTLYFRAAAGPSTGFAWFLGGFHADTAADPGDHGNRVMRLDGDGLRIEAGAGSLTLGSPTQDSGGQIAFRRSGDASKGFDVQLENDAPGRLSLRGNLAFGTQTRQMLDLWGSGYGIGVQSSATYFRTGGDFLWFKGGSHTDANGSPGAGGQALMKLSREGRIGLGTDSPAYSFDVRAGAAVGRWTSTNNGFGSVLVLQNTTALSSSSYLGAINFETANTTSGQIGYLSNDQMVFRVGGNQRMVIDAAGNVGIAGAFSQASDRNAKQEIHAVDTEAVLKKVVDLPIAEWSYRQDPSTRHVGPMAQDFHAAFGLGPDDRHITTVDADGVALAAIQGLNRRLQEVRRENAELRERLERLERRLAGGTDR